METATYLVGSASILLFLADLVRIRRYIVLESRER